MITLCYFRNTFPSSISNLVLYWAGNNILAGVGSILDDHDRIKRHSRPSSDLGGYLFAR